MTDYYAATIPGEGIFGVGKTEAEAMGKAVEYFASSDIPISKEEVTIQKISEDLYNYSLKEYGGIVTVEEHNKRWKKVQDFRKYQSGLISTILLGDPNLYGGEPEQYVGGHS
jgi:hypothetical protein